MDIATLRFQIVVTKQCTHSVILSRYCGDACFQFSPIRRYKYEHSNHGVHSAAEHRATNRIKNGREENGRERRRGERL